MANRYPLIIDATDKKLKELPIGDNLRVDGDIITQGNITAQTVVANTLNGELTGDVTGNLIGDVIGNLTGDVIGSVFADDSTLLIDSVNSIIPGENIVGTITANILGSNNQVLVDSNNNTISYLVLSDTPFIPTDISQLNDEQGLLGDGSTIDEFGTFLSLEDTPNVYSFGANKFLKVNNDETAIEYGEINQQDVEFALGYLPYDGLANPLGFINEEIDDLNSVVERGNSTQLSISVNSLSASSVVSTNVNLKTFLEFFDNDQTNEFQISVESDKILTIAGRFSIDTSSSNIQVLNSSFIGDQNSTIGNETNFWNNIYADTVNSNIIKNNPNQPLVLETDNDINLAITTPNRKVKITGFGAFRLPVLDNAQKNNLTPEQGDVIYNQEESTVQVYVGTIGFTEEGDPIPGWINLYTPPQDN